METDVIILKQRTSLSGITRMQYGPLCAPDGSPMPMTAGSSYPDEYLDYWGEIFAAEQLHRHGLTFEEFLRAPRGYYAALQGRPFPLLERQRQAAEQADIDALPLQILQIAEEMEAETIDRTVQRGPQLIEPLRHHAWPWKR